MPAHCTAQIELRALAQLTAGFSPSGLERYKLDRLRELRAVIESLRTEREHLAALDVRNEARSGR